MAAGVVSYEVWYLICSYVGGSILCGVGYSDIFLSFSLFSLIHIHIHTELPTNPLTSRQFSLTIARRMMMSSQHHHAD